MKPDIPNRYGAQPKGFGSNHRSSQSDSYLVCPNNQVVDLAYNGIKLLTVFLTSQPSAVKVCSEHQKNRSLRNMFLAAAQLRKFFPSLLLLNDNNGYVLEIYPVRGCLHCL